MIQFSGVDAWLIILEFLSVGTLIGILIGYYLGYKYASEIQGEQDE